MNIALWILQALLATIFGTSGLMKASSSKESLKEKGGERMAWVDSVSNSNIKLIGISQILAAIGLILPQATGILPWLSPLAAIGLILTMLGAMALHAQRKDGPQAFVTNGVLLVLAAMVAYGRFILIPA